jgi:glycosyltransferase involved in cell wall biosynthesis
MNLAEITPLVLTFNEASNISRCLERLCWAARVVVVDSFSTDETVAIVARYPNVHLFQRKFDFHAAQWNYGVQETGIQSDWILSLDADYLMTPALVNELRALEPQPSQSAFRVPFSYHVLGRALRGNAYPPVAALFRRRVCSYEQDGHTQRLVWQRGQAGELRSAMIHDDRKSLARWLQSQSKYMDLESAKLLETPNAQLGFTDRLRKKIVFAPLAVLFYCLVVQRGLLDGWAGWYYALQRLTAETILSLKLIERRFSRDAKAVRAQGLGDRSGAAPVTQE